MSLRSFATRVAPLFALSVACACGEANTHAFQLPVKEEGDPLRTRAGSGASGPDPAEAADASARADQREWSRLANETHDFVVGHLLTPFGSYRTFPGEALTDEWHDASQLGADAAMLGMGEKGYSVYVDATSGFLDKLWDRASPSGGYFPRAAIDGSNVESATKYVDDNGLSGVTWLDARDAVAEPAKKEAFLGAARSAANFLMQGGVWDATYGGGFWWNTDRPDKPTQTNGLALQLFLRLGAITGEPYYTDWASGVFSWLEGTMFDVADGLYAWKWEAGGRNGAKFTYDQAILIDAYVLRFTQTKDATNLERARALAEALHAKLWAQEGGYVISSEDRRLSPVFSGWASCSLVRLHAVDPDPKWLARAKDNARALDRVLRDPDHHGYYSAGKPDGSEVTKQTQSVDQAWMQRAQAMIAQAQRN
jgi:hypothetical protein